MIDFVRTTSRQRRMFQCPHCGGSYTLGQFSGVCMSNTYRETNAFTCQRCNTSSIVEVKMEMKARVFKHEEENLGEEQINLESLF